MTLPEFQKSLSQAKPPEVSPLLLALWQDAKGDWKKAHEICQESETPDAAWVHAYLHRKEGDEGNAGYWYHRAGKNHSKLPLEGEWAEIAQALLQKESS